MLNNNVKCPVCGSKLEQVGPFAYHCPFCENSYDNADLGIGNKESASFDPSNPKVNYQNKNVKDGEEIYEENILGSCSILARNRDQTGANGSGLLVSEDGYVITNNHVVTDEERERPFDVFFVQIGDQVVEATLVEKYGNKNIDLALLKMKRPLTKAKKLHCGDSSKVKCGERAYAIGNSLGEGLCITSGIISDIDREVFDMSCIMADVPTNPGNSGGPLFNGQGEVIAICVAGVSTAKGMNYFIPINFIRNTIKKHVTI